MSNSPIHGFADRFIIIVLAAALAAGLGLFAAQKFFAADQRLPGVSQSQLRSVRLIASPRVLPAYRLLLSDGTALTPGRLAGHWTVVFLGFTHCPDVCPTILAEFAGAQKSWASLPESIRPRLLFVSVDPERDTPEKTGEYAHYFHADKGQPNLQPVSGRDLMLAFDVSASMATPDLRLDGKPTARLRVARTLAYDFLKRRQGDRVGLIVFGSQAYLHTPLTFDLEAVRAALATMETGFAGPETALGDAIGLATKHLAPLADHSRELVLLTDGANTAGTLAPQRAAWLAQRAGVRIHAIGIGAARVVADAGKQADGLDEATLQQIVEQSGGSYRRAADSAELEDFFRALDKIQPSTQGAVTVRPQRALYPWPLGLAFLLSVGLALRRSRQTTP